MKFFPPNTLELTFAMIKPNVIKVPLIVQLIQEEIIKNNFLVIRSKRCVMNSEHIKKLYEEHEGKPFYHRLTSFMSSDSIECYLLARQDAIKTWREMMGPTKVFKSQYTHPHSIRGMFGHSDTRNVTHGSDSPESVAREASVFFPDFCIPEWYAKEEIYFRNGFVRFDEKSFIHSKDDDCSTWSLLQNVPTDPENVTNKES